MMYDEIIDRAWFDSARTLAANGRFSIGVRLRFIRDYLAAQDEAVLERLLEREQTAATGRVLKAVEITLDAVSKSADRARILRMFLSQLPAELANLALPDGTHAAISGHLIERLMTRFNARTAIDALRLLHRRAAKLRIAQLPVLIQVAQKIHRLTTATHWQFADELALVETGGVLVTAYFPPVFKHCPHAQKPQRARHSMHAG